MIKTARDLQEYLYSLCEVEEPSVDRIIIGDADTVIIKVGTCWLPYLTTLKTAYEKGINVLICHEPTFYSYLDLEAHETEYSWAERVYGYKKGNTAYRKMIKEKEAWILEHHMVVIRCHDVMDRLSDIGMPFALGKVLGFEREDIIRQITFHNVYKVSKERAGIVAQQIANHLKAINQPGVAFYGDLEREVSSVCIGTGCFSDPIEAMELEADFYVVINDAIRTWVQTAYSKDSGLPMIVINHGTSEETGMRLLCEHLQDKMQCACIHFEQGCDYHWIGAK